jgi:hypothetical protein
MPKIKKILQEITYPDLFVFFSRGVHIIEPTILGWP